MSRTLFFYIFRDLLRIFLLTSGALAGIMSFGGLLRPLTEQGLNASQAARMLSYFMPAMTTYSLPIAALFATTMVYGRLSADNELTACRSAGISYISIGIPACMLGLTVAIVSLLFLCFIVPVFTLKVERVIYSNLAQLIAGQIERTHQIKFSGTTIFAQEAAVRPPDPAHPREQVVSLGGLMIVTFDKQPPPTKGQPQVQVPREFYLAREATVFIRPSRNGEEFTLSARLDGGATFPRKFTTRDTSRGGLVATEYGPVLLSSLIKEDTKFMDIARLHELHNDLSRSRRVQDQLQKIVRQQQEADFATRAYDAISRRQPFTCDAGRERYEISATRGRPTLHAGKLTITGGGRLVQYAPDGKRYLTADAAEVELAATAMADDQLNVQVRLNDVSVETEEGPSPRPGFTRTFVVPATLNGATLDARGLSWFQQSGEISSDDKLLLYREILKIGNAVQSEIHARVAFAVSCLILVLVGCCLGMMFKSGNFLSAFALSVMPALLCVALIVAGQHTATNVPYKVDADFRNPLNLGLGLIWSGNVAAAVLAGVLWSRMQRQ